MTEGKQCGRRDGDVTNQWTKEKKAGRGGGTKKRRVEMTKERMEKKRESG